LYITGNPSGLTNDVPDCFALTWTDNNTTLGGTIPKTGSTFGTGNIPFFDPDTGAQITDAQIQTAIQNSAANSPANTGMYNNITVVEDVRDTVGVNDSITSFTITYGDKGTPVLPTVTNQVTQSDYSYDADFILLDDELPSLPLNATAEDTFPGLVIQTRAQNTWLRRGLRTVTSSGAGVGPAPPGGSDLFGVDGSFGVDGDYGV
jgi:hypothetical protein